METSFRTGAEVWVHLISFFPVGYVLKPSHVSQHMSEKLNTKYKTTTCLLIKDDFRELDLPY